MKFIPLLLAFLLVSCNVTPPTHPRVDPGAIGKSAQEAAKADTAQAKADDEQRKRLATAAASVETIEAVNESQPPGPKTDAIRDEAKIAKANIGEKPDPVALIEAERRAKMREEGRADEARKSADAALKKADELSAAHALAQREAKEAREALAKGIAQAQADISAQNARHDQQTRAQQAEIAELKRKLDEQELSLITYIVAGIGGVCLLGAIGLAVAAFHSVAGWSLRTVWTVGLLIASSVLCFGLVRFLSHPWWPHVIGGGLGILLLAAGVMQFMSWRENKAKLLAQQAAANGTAKEYTELEQTSALIVDAIEKAAKAAPNAMKPVFEDLKDNMDGLHKDWVAYLKTLRPSKTDTPKKLT